MNLHTYGGVFIRPLGSAPDARMGPGDLALYRQLAAWGEEYVGYPTVSAYEEFTYEPEKPVYGDLDAYAYHQRGCIAAGTVAVDAGRGPVEYPAPAAADLRLCP